MASCASPGAWRLVRCLVVPRAPVPGSECVALRVSISQPCACGADAPDGDGHACGVDVPAASAFTRVSVDVVAWYDGVAAAFESDDDDMVRHGHHRSWLLLAAVLTTVRGIGACARDSELVLCNDCVSAGEQSGRPAGAATLLASAFALDECTAFVDGAASDDAIFLCKREPRAHRVTAGCMRRLLVPGDRLVCGVSFGTPCD